MTEASLTCHGRRQGCWPLAAALALLLTACGGGDGGTLATDAGAVATPAATVTQKGFGPTELFHPATNPTGRVLQEGDTGIVFLPQAGASGVAEQQVWFEIVRASNYGFEMEDEDLAVLGRVDVSDAAGGALLSVDADHRFASATLAPGRYALRLVASATNPETVPLFIRFDAGGAQPGQPAATGRLVPLAYSGSASPSMFAKDCIGCDLRGVNLGGLNLRSANMRSANLSGANLSGANLEDTFLHKANLEGAILSKAYLRGAYLIGASLRSANLGGANLSQARLTEADLSKANLERAILLGASLGQANLSGANLSGANLGQASLGEALWVDGRTCAWFSLGQCE